MANRINLNQTSFHGAGAINEIAAEVKVRGLKKALVCSDPDLIKFNVTTKVTKVLEDAGLEYELYSDIKPNPTIQNVQHGVEAFKKAGADYIGVGAVFTTSTKLDHTRITFETLKEITSTVSIPVVAIGGISADNLTQLKGTGIDGISVISAIFGQPDPGAATKDLLHRTKEMLS